MAPFYENDIVYVKNQTEPAQNGYYVINQNSWDKIPMLQNPIFLQNNYDSYWFGNDIATPTTDKRQILINGTRAFDFFDSGEVNNLARVPTLVAAV